ncbi:MAG TPA: rhodanese-like domain-containing protein [Chthoniobacteraceae bacterium]|jgi:rhodanese-related sulfurtransferase|nr:rhodanese-like domain-containing protein [Chthoniobacteraceae bacterium]
MRLLLRQVISILGLALLPAIAAGIWHPRRPSWQSDEVTLAAATAWGRNVLWIDARPNQEFQRGHIPGALPLNEDRWDDLLPAVLDQWDTTRKIVVYCSSLSCQTSHDVARRLREEAQISNVYVLQGGWEAWAAQHPLIHANQ